MRIGIDYTSALNQRAGIGRFTRELVAALLAGDDGDDYVLLRPRRPRSDVPPALRQRATVRSLPLTDWGMTVLWQRLRLPLPMDWLTGPLDVFHAPDFLLPPLRRTPAVLTVHDLTFLRYPEHAPPGLASFLSAALPRSLERASLVLADSVCTRDDLVSLLGMPPAKIEVVPGGVEARFAPADEAAQREAMARHGLESPFILSVGTLEPRKNLGRLVDAYARLVREAGIPHLLALAGGRGWGYEPLLAQIAQSGLESRVRLLGHVPDADLPPLLSAATVFVFPSLYEGFGLPVLEAMACGAAIVCSDASCIPEVAGDAALLAPPSDEPALAAAIHRLLHDADLRRTLSSRARARAAGFTWEAAAQKTLAAYHRAAATRRVA